MTFGVGAARQRDRPGGDEERSALGFEVGGVLRKDGEARLEPVDDGLARRGAGDPNRCGGEFRGADEAALELGAGVGRQHVEHNLVLESVRPGESVAMASGQIPIQPVHPPDGCARRKRGRFPAARPIRRGQHRIRNREIDPEGKAADR